VREPAAQHDRARLVELAEIEPRVGVVDDDAAITSPPLSQ
jgi:hypothetical protein